MSQPAGNETLRPMAYGDLLEVAALEAAIFPDPWSGRLYEETLKGGLCDCYVMKGRADGKESLIGYFVGQKILDEAEIHRIAVRPALRGKGYGQLLLADFLKRMRDAGVLSVLLEVRAGNGAGIGLYRKNGFAPVGTRRDYYRNPKEDAVIMQKRF